MSWVMAPAQDWTRELSEGGFRIGSESFEALQAHC